MRRLLLLIVLSCLLKLSVGQVPYPRITKIAENRGLFLENEVSDVKVDSEGYVWIISFSEIVRYNGKDFKKYENLELIHDSFLKFKEGDNGSKYVFDIAGRIFFIRSDSLIPYKYNHLILEKNPWRKVPRIKIDVEGAVHFIIDGTIPSVIKEGIVEELIDTSKIKGFIDENRASYIISLDDSLMFYHFSFPSERRQKQINNYVHTFYLISKDYQLIDSISTRSRVSNSSNRSYIKMPSGKYLIGNYEGKVLELSETGIEKEFNEDWVVLNLFKDSQNGLWVSTKGRGVFYFKDYDLNKEFQYHFFPKTETIVSAEDSEGGVWCYSEEGGVFRIERPDITYYINENFKQIDQRVEVIKLVEDTLYFSKESNSLGKINLKSNKVDTFVLPLTDFQKKRNSDNLNIISIEYDNTNQKLWLTQRNHIRYKSKEGGDWRVLHSDSMVRVNAERYLLSSTSGQSNISFIGTHNFQFFIGDVNNYTFISPELPYRLYGLSLKGDSVFLNSDDGVYLYYNSTIKRMGDDYSFLNNKLTGHIVWNDQLWLATKKDGLFVLGQDGFKELRYNAETLPDIRLVSQDSNNLWLLSDNGSFNVLKENNDYTIKAYQALPKNFYTDFESSANRLFAGTKRSGILTVDFDRLKAIDRTFPLLNIEKIKVGEKEILNTDTVCSVKYTTNSLRVWFSGITYGDRSTRYRYRLKGLNSQWNEVNQGYAQYSNLKAGDYSLEIQARRDSQTWGASKVFKLFILPPFWETWWFLITIVILLFIIINLIISYRIKVANREKSLVISSLTAEQNALRAQMDPHFMFNVIASIQHLVEEGTKEKTNQFLDMFAKSLRNILSNTGNNFIKIEDEILFLKEYVEMERFRLEDHFDFEIKHNLTRAQLVSYIPPFMIQPFVENAIQHGLKNKEEQGDLLIQFSVDGQFLKVCVEDDGIGRKRASAYKKKDSKRSQGVKLVKDRLQLYNIRKENVIVEDLIKDSGTRVYIYIRIQVSLKE